MIIMKKVSLATDGERQFLQRPSHLLNNHFSNFFTAVEENSSITVMILPDCLHEAGRFLISKFTSKSKQPKWWDEDCSQKVVKYISIQKNR